MSVEAQTAAIQSAKTSISGMKRLVYAPRAYVFVKDREGQIHDLTRFTVSGEVNRLLDQVSTATVNLRNPGHLFTVHKEGDRIVEPKFLPMDPITIYLRRVRRRPVRVFTGFLDKVPYAQLLPGIVTLKASCTLKRLLYTYFDPALPYTMSFLTNYGWIPYNGQWVSLTGMKDWLPPGVDPTTQNANPPNPIGKGSKIALFGDSIAEGISKSKALGSNVTFSQTKTGRQTVDTIKAIKAAGSSLPETVVVASGSNDDPTDDAAFKLRIEQVLSLIGDGRHLIWVNLHGTNYTNQDLTQLNPTLDAEADKHGNMTVVHWNTIIESEDIAMDSHGLHTTSAGYARLGREVKKVADQGAVGGVTDANKLKNPGSTDGSLSQLLMATMQHIGHWDPNQVYIEAMPEKLFDHMRDLATEFANDSKEAQEEFKTLLKNILGSGGHGSASGSDGATIGGEVKGQAAITRTIVSIADKYGVDSAMAMAVADIESGYGTNMHRPGANYHGWYQIDITGSRYSPPITIEQANDLKYSCTLFCKGAQNTVPDSVKKESPLAWAMYTQGVNGQNNPLYPQEWPTAYAKAKKFISQYASISKGLPDNSTLNPLGTAGGVDQTVRSNRKGGTNKTSTTSKIYAPIPGWDGRIGGVYGEPRSSPHPHIHAGVDVDVPRGTKCVAPVDGTIGIAASGGFAPGEGGPDGAGGGMVHFIFDEDQGEIKAGTVLGWGHIEKLYVSKGQKVKAGEVIALSGWTTGGDHVHFIARRDDNAMDGYQDKSMDPTPILNTLQKGDDHPIGTADGSASGGASSSDPSATDANPAAAGAFFASLELPSMYDAVEASMLTGEKSLLNDKPLLPFIQQLCSASLRHFQSLPDGRFYAFYPDYYGEMNQHPPYWEIDDIEILDGKIELSDDTLVTHEYVVGDTVNPMVSGETPFALRSVFSSGVVTIFNAFMANSVLDRDKSRKKNKQQAQRKAKTHDEKQQAADDGMGILLDRQEVSDFLERYGARPHVEDMPMIKSPYFEMFLAYQRFLLAWSKQFSTPFSFTFMPEIFPGGKLGFPGHGLQMYVEQVTHSWDYESGFTTTASLTAPSVYGSHTNLLPPNMVQAIIKPPAKGK